MTATHLMIKLFSMYILFIICAQTYQITALSFSEGSEDPEFENAVIEKNSTSIQLHLKDRVVYLLNVPDVWQATDYTCGPSSATAILNYYGIDDYRESDIAKLAETSEEYGTDPYLLSKALNSLKISCEVKQLMKISDLEGYIDKKMPIMVEIQAWRDDDSPQYPEDWIDGHYVVAIGYDDKYFYFEDPWILGSITYMTRKDFGLRWHDYIHVQQKNVFALGLIISLPSTQTPPIRYMQ